MFDLGWIRYLFSPRWPKFWWWAWFGISLGGALGCGIAYYRFGLQVNSLFLLGYGSTLLALFILGKPQFPTKQTILFMLGVALIYGGLHLPVFEHAPWNGNGIFDDAAWDLFLMKRSLGKVPWQSLRFDEIGIIDREYIFHTVMYFWFELFGYTVKSFNYALLFLGGTTVLFAALAVRSYFSSRVGWVASIVMTMQPFHYTHQFLGHRYVIALPLLAATLYFLALTEKYIQATSLKDGPTMTDRDGPARLVWYGLWSMLLLGLTVMSSIMGRQVLYALFFIFAAFALHRFWLGRHKIWASFGEGIAVIKRLTHVPLNRFGVLLDQELYAEIKAGQACLKRLVAQIKSLLSPPSSTDPELANFRAKFEAHFKMYLVPCFIGVLLLAIIMLPHLIYLLSDQRVYFGREHDLMAEFFKRPYMWWPRVIHTAKMLWMPILGRSIPSYSRFSMDAALLPVWIWPLWLVGLYHAFKKRRFFLFVLNFVPILGAYVAGPFDFRYFFAVPAWMITLGTGLGVLWPGRWLKIWWGDRTWPERACWFFNIVLIMGVIFALVVLGRRGFAYYHDQIYLAWGVWGGGLLFLIVSFIPWFWAIRKNRPTMAAWWRSFFAVGSMIILLSGLIFTGWRLYRLADSPVDFHSLIHVDVGRARMMQDLLRGRSYAMANFHDADELNPPQLGRPNTVVGVCSIAYGVVHLFLQNKGKNSFFGLCRGPMSVLRWQEVWSQNRSFWLSLVPQRRNHYLFIWDFTPAQAPLYSFLRQLRAPGELKILTSFVDEVEVKIFYLAQTATQFRIWQNRIRNYRRPVFLSDK